MNSLGSLMRALTSLYNLALFWWNGGGLKSIAIDGFVRDPRDRSAVRHPSGWRGVPDVPEGTGGRGGRGYTPLGTGTSVLCKLSEMPRLFFNRHSPEEGKGGGGCGRSGRPGSATGLDIQGPTGPSQHGLWHDIPKSRLPCASGSFRTQHPSEHLADPERGTGAMKYVYFVSLYGGYGVRKYVLYVRHVPRTLVLCTRTPTPRTTHGATNVGGYSTSYLQYVPPAGTRVQYHYTAAPSGAVRSLTFAIVPRTSHRQR